MNNNWYILKTPRNRQIGVKEHYCEFISSVSFLGETLCGMMIGEGTKIEINNKGFSKCLSCQKLLEKNK